MKKQKKKMIYSSVKKIFPIIIFLITVLMGVGYASINSIIIGFDGEVIAKEVSGIYITEVNYSSDVDADLDNSKILSAYQTSLSSSISLSDDNEKSSITYKINILNNTDDDYSFIDTIYDLELYDNLNIVFQVDNLLRGDILHAGEDINFTITFKYKSGVDLVNISNILNSSINFHFQKRPNIVIGSYVSGYNHRINENDEVLDTTYVSPMSRNGANWDATYTMDGVSNYDTTKLEWRIIGYENDQLLITTTDEITAVEGRYYQANKGKAGVTYMLSEMDNISSIYGQGKFADTSKYSYNLDGLIINSGARSMKLSDLGFFVESFNTRTYRLNYSANNSSKLVVWYSSPLVNPTSMLESEFDFLEYFDESSQNWISLEKVNQNVTIEMNNYNIPNMTDLQHSMIYQGSDGRNLKYFLADRYVHVDDLNFGLGRIGYGCPYVQDDQTVFGHGIYWSNGTVAGAPRTVRPVVYLKSNTIIEYDETTGVYSLS